MTRLVKKTGSRIVRWYMRRSEQQKARGRWYNVDHCGVH
jgi:hypothetical protein